MDFGTYLLYTQKITQSQYMCVLATQARVPLISVPAAPVAKPLSAYSVEELRDVRALPFGEIAKTLVTGDKKEKVVPDVEALVAEWQAWHLKNLEPIATYSLSSEIGGAIYSLDVEKKMVASFLTSESAETEFGKIILDGDIVAMPEGSSTLYVGLAIARDTRHAEIITTNGVLMREYRDNPEVAKALQRFYLIGGEPDYDKATNRSEHGGFQGADTVHMFATQISAKPATTVLVVPSAGLLPNKGPYDLTAKICDQKKSLITTALEAGVRSIVFIADYSKHDPNTVVGRRITRNPVFSDPREWGKLFDNHRDKLFIVTVPPPDVRADIKSGKLDASPSKRPAETIPRGPYEKYLAAAREFDELSRGTRLGTSRFYEVINFKS